MRPIVNLASGTMLAASLITAGTALADESAASATQATPAQGEAKIGKSRSNIQNNREAPVAKDDAAPTGNDESTELVKSKTKSNQSND